MNSHKEARTIRVAAIQIESKHGLIEANHEHAAPFIEKAAQAGAKLVVLPELFSTGYIPNPSLWESAEPQDGKTVTWLKKTSKRLEIYLGAGLVESDGQDFLNVFLLTDPDGEIAGRVVKTEAESYIFKRSNGGHVIDTSLGKIGVGICADNQMATFLKQMAEESVDLMLMPHGWPTPCKTSTQVAEQDIQEQHEKVKQLVELYARSLGIPTIFVNGVGPMGRMIGLLGRFMDPEIFRLEGFSRIVDSDGKTADSLASEEGVVIMDVTLDPARKQYVQPAEYNAWLLPGTAISRKIMIPFDVNFGQIWYMLNPARRKKARECLSQASAGKMYNSMNA